MTTAVRLRQSVGDLLREWRQRRRLSQLELSIRAEVSTRHLSFVETGRSKPSSTMVLRLAEELDVPLRERNQLLLAAGYAPAYGQSDLQSPRMEAIRTALGQILRGHQPNPAVVVDRSWNIVAHNDSIALLIANVAPQLLAPPMNALRVTLHPDGMAPRIINHGQWRGHLLARLRRHIAVSADTALSDLYDELCDYPCDDPAGDVEIPGPQDIAVPLRLRHPAGELSFFSTVATFGTPLDITTEELAIESFFPADPATAAALQGN